MSSRNISSSKVHRSTKPIRPDYSMMSNDLRLAFDIGHPTMTELLQKLKVDFVEEEKSSRSRHIPPQEVRRVLEYRGYKFHSTERGRGLVYSFMICKGGTGKSTSARFVSQRLSSMGARCLVIDADPQGNLTASFSLNKYDYKIDEKTPVILDVLEKKFKLEDILIKVTPHLDLVPSTLVNSTMENEILKSKNPAEVLREHLEPLLPNYDYCIIDCAPALNRTNLAMIAASDTVVLPVNPDMFSKIGLDQTLGEILEIEKQFAKQGLKVEKRVLYSKFDARETTSLRYLSEIAKDREDLLYKTVVKASADVKNAIANDVDLFSINKSQAKSDYDALTREIMGFDAGLKIKRRQPEG